VAGDRKGASGWAGLTLPTKSKKLRRDPDLFLVAELDGRMIGTVIGGFDGRRPDLSPGRRLEHRQSGLGARLMDEVKHACGRKAA
jgi:hypothetical protein